MAVGIKVGIDGENEYKKALKDITSNLKLMSSEMKLTSTEFERGDKNLKQTKASYDNINKSVQDQKEKISNLRTALEEAEKTYGKNNTVVQELKTKLNQAEVQMKQMEDATDKSNKELKEMKDGFNDAGEGAVKFGDLLKANILGDAIVGGVKALGSAVKSIGSAFLGIGKQALDGYADFEQLFGGVETLFGTGSIGTIEEYAEGVGKSVEAVTEEYNKLYDSLIDVEQAVLSNANNAYKTAGLSANEYLETVTSFSASLIKSLDGDTAKSAEYANRAIIDMSDNANKMGTDISMIQNAYQGFAKQNYTMLDNLKLGYGGTKGEMEQLIYDASKMTDIQEKLGITVDESSMSFANIVNAISVMQESMGIAGTTAKEASSTISGSISSMKSAWTNLVTGIADDTVDFQGLINNFVDSIITVGDNILPRVEIIIEGIVDLVMSLANKLVEHTPKLLETGMSLLQKILDGITSMIPSLMPVVINIVNSLVNFITQNLPTIIKAGIDILVSLVKGIADSLPTLIPAMVDAVILIVETLIDNIDLIIDAGIQLILGLADGLIEALPRLIEKAPEIIEKLCDAIIRNLPKIFQAGGELIGKLIMGITGSFWKLLEKAPEIVGNIVKGILGVREQMKNAGKNLIEGLWNGISGMAEWVYNKIKGFADNIVGNIKKVLGIHSPSKVFEEEVGKNMALGIGEGFGKTMSDVSRDMESSIPTEFDTNVNMKSSSSVGSSYNNMVDAFKKALTDVKVVMNDREMGTFVSDTMERVIYS